MADHDQAYEMIMALASARRIGGDEAATKLARDAYGVTHPDALGKDGLQEGLRNALRRNASKLEAE